MVVPLWIHGNHDPSLAHHAACAPWSEASTVATDCTLQQLAPYIGRVKTSIARYVINRYTQPGDLVCDPFCGSGVIPLELHLAGRKAVAGDTNPYAVILTRAKLGAPHTLEQALTELRACAKGALRRVDAIDLRRVPLWVRRFFHPDTLRSALAYRDECVSKDNVFLLACLLGILHHQRPGFLSYPSSHLVPYLRTKLFPRSRNASLYEPRDVLSRLEKKVRRTFRRIVDFERSHARVQLVTSSKIRVKELDAVITSPPYMNELDYVRDNRLRLWFALRELPKALDIPRRGREPWFAALMAETCGRLAGKLKRKGVFALVVGEAGRGGRRSDTAGLVVRAFEETPELTRFRLIERVDDVVPDVRRARRDLRGTKNETLLVYKGT